MPGEHPHKILMVDDEESILKALKRVLKDIGAELIAVTSGAEALALLQKDDISLIISDQRMPQITGVELLSKCREVSPDTIRILLTGYADIDATVEAINSGAVRYYMNKPWDNAVLVSRILESLQLYETTVENERLYKLTQQQKEKLIEFNQTLQKKVDQQTARIKEQHADLKKSFMETIRAFSIMVGLRLKDVASHSQRVATVAKMLLDGLDLDERQRQDIIVASYLHDIGKIGLPETIAAKTAEMCSPQEKEVYYRHPVLGQSCVHSISGFEEIGMIIRHHHENYDGTGYPDCLRGQGIPLGARILRICNEFDNVGHQDEYPDLKTLARASATLRRHSGTWFDPELVKAFDRLEIANKFYNDDSSGVIGLRPDALKEGMVAAADIRTVSDVFLLPKGAKLSAGMIHRINKIHAVDPIIEAIRVYSRSAKTEEKVNVPT